MELGYIVNSNNLVSSELANKLTKLKETKDEVFYMLARGVRKGEEFIPDANIEFKYNKNTKNIGITNIIVINPIESKQTVEKLLDKLIEVSKYDLEEPAKTIFYQPIISEFEGVGDVLSPQEFLDKNIVLVNGETDGYVKETRLDTEFAKKQKQLDKDGHILYMKNKNNKAFKISEKTSNVQILKEVHLHHYYVNKDDLDFIVNELKKAIPELTSDQECIIKELYSRMNLETALHSLNTVVTAKELLNHTDNEITKSIEDKTQFLIGLAIHDAGKIIVHRKFLEKQEDLTDQDYFQISRHARNSKAVIDCVIQEYNKANNKNIKTDIFSNIAYDIAREHHLNSPEKVMTQNNNYNVYAYMASLIDVTEACSTALRCYKQSMEPETIAKIINNLVEKCNEQNGTKIPKLYEEAGQMTKDGKNLLQIIYGVGCERYVDKMIDKVIKDKTKIQERKEIFEKNLQSIR